MKKNLSQRVQRIKPSPTLAITAQAKALQAEGKDIIGLGAGEPDFDTPDHIKKAAVHALDAGFTKYTAVDGTPELKQAIINKFKRDNGLRYTPEQVLVSCGGKHSFYNLVEAFISSGNEVIIPAPYWVSYPEMVLLANGEPVIIKSSLERGFKITPQQLAAAITPDTRLFIINSPSNPSGATYSADELLGLAEVLKRHPNILIVSDDIYEHIRLNDTPFVNILTVCPDLYERCVIINGVSKAYSMTGWRIGYAAGPAWLIEAMKKIQSQSTSNPCSISQIAAQAALDGEQSCMDQMIEAFRQRHEFTVSALNSINGIQCLHSQGAFYSFPDCQDVIKRIPNIHDDIKFGEYLLDKIGIALIPGSAFGAPGHMRVSFATSMEQLERAFDRLSNLLNN
ncbi:MAG: pyridoxal phosphate-dependent aminotransferase [Gammaproteobacteria bacterium]|nr:pyridoxal phosphate-dependent aminotransferase [Gammaproteobacteria bacterium]